MSLLNEVVVRLTARSSPGLSDAAEGRIYFDSTQNKFLVSENGGAYVDLATAGDITLDAAYDGGGSGAGRTVTVDAGAIQFNDNAVNNTNVLEITKSPAGAQSGSGITVTMGSNATSPAAVFSGATTASATVYVGNGMSAASPVTGTLAGTDASAAATAGGDIRLLGGVGNTSGSGGAARLLGGTAGATGVGGGVVLTAAAGGTTSGVGGTVVMTGGAGTAGNSAGGAVSLTGGAGQGSAAGGTASLTGGAGGATGSGASASVTGGAGGSTSGTGGAVTLTGGAGTAGNSTGGAVTAQGGAGQGSANGAVITLQGGTGGATGNGANVVVNGGIAGAAAGTGGEIVFQTATAAAGTTLVERNRVTSDGALDTTGIATASAPAVSAASHGRIYYDSTLQQYMASLNGGTYKPLTGGAGLSTGVVTKTANYTITQSDFTIRANNGGGGTITMTLSTIAAAIRGQIFVVKRVNAGAGAANRVTVAAGGSDTIDGAASTNLNAQYAVLRVQAPDTGTDWMVI